MKPVVLRRTVYLLVAFAFIGGLAGEAYGHHGDHAHDHRSQCSCVGICHGAAASPVPAQPEPGVAASEIAERNARPPSDRRLFPRLRRYVLPLANAPPGPRFFARP